MKKFSTSLSLLFYLLVGGITAASECALSTRQKVSLSDLVVLVRVKKVTVEEIEPVRAFDTSSGEVNTELSLEVVKVVNGECSEKEIGIRIVKLGRDGFNSTRIEEESHFLAFLNYTERDGYSLAESSNQFFEPAEERKVFVVPDFYQRTGEILLEEKIKVIEESVDEN